MPSGVRSRGPNPVPPVVTTSPVNPRAWSRSALAHRPDAVGDDHRRGDREPGLAQPLGHRRTAPVGAAAVGHAVGHHDHLRVHRPDPNRARFQRKTAMPSVPSACGRSSDPLPHGTQGAPGGSSDVKAGCAAAKPSATSIDSALVSVQTE